jgi:hypothetical protein
MLHLTPVICWRGLEQAQSILTEYTYAESSYITHYTELTNKKHTYSRYFNKNKKTLRDKLFDKSSLCLPGYTIPPPPSQSSLFRKITPQNMFNLVFNYKVTPHFIVS